MRKHLSSWHLPWLHVRKDIRRGKQTQKQGKRVFCLKSLKIYAFDRYDNLNVYITWRTCNMICFKFPHLQFGDFFLPIYVLQLYVIHIKGKPCAHLLQAHFNASWILWGVSNPPRIWEKNFRGMHASRVTGGLCEQMLQLLRILKAENCGKKGSVFSNGCFSSSIQRSKGPPKVYKYYKILQICSMHIGDPYDTMTTSFEEVNHIKINRKRAKVDWILVRNSSSPVLRRIWQTLTVPNARGRNKKLPNDCHLPHNSLPSNVSFLFAEMDLFRSNSSWWFQPIWKNISQNGFIFPR